MDVEFANLLSRYNMKIVGNKEYENLSPEVKKRTLTARMSMTASGVCAFVNPASFDPCFEN
jgi:hypothetical protein